MQARYCGGNRRRGKWKSRGVRFVTVPMLHRYPTDATCAKIGGWGGGEAGEREPVGYPATVALLTPLSRPSAGAPVCFIILQERSTRSCAKVQRAREATTSTDAAKSTRQTVYRGGIASAR